jgi:hypothetical protein
MKEKKWDVFISHASEDKSTVARPLAEALKRAGVRVWLDEHELKIGDSLSEKIDNGLSESQFGVVILSPAFLEKHWPRKELSGLRAREEDGQKVILPVWHNVDKSMITQFSPILADVLAVNTNESIGYVAQKIIEVIFTPTSDSPSAKNPSVTRRLIEILESVPEKADFIDFLRSHSTYLLNYINWGGRLELKKYQLYGIEFDAYATYANHGCALTLIRFTESWENPFDTDDMIVRNPKICREVEHTISSIRSLQQRYKKDTETHARLRDELGYRRSSVTPVLLFFIFAGRRSSIDLSRARHNAWSRLLKKNSDIQIKSYDYIIDAFFK